MKISAIIVAAGTGTRAGGGLPKQYRPLGGSTVLGTTLKAVLAAPEIEEIITVISAECHAHYADATADINTARLQPPVIGGATRSASVLAGLEAVSGDYVLIHDAARPFVTPAQITDLVEALSPEQGAFLALPVVDALWTAPEGQALAPKDRSNLWRAQTPQAFPVDKLRAAFLAADGPADDDVALAVAHGLRVKTVLGSEENFKLTYPADFARAEKMLRG